MPDEQQPSWRRRSRRARRPLAITGTVVLLAGFVWLWWQGVPALYQTAGAGPDAENARLSAVATTRAALLAGLVGLGALGTFWLNSRVYRITARTFEVTERGHLTDRYAKAIEQLGDDKLDVRLGGIYSLEQIAHDSSRDRDQATIVEVLSAFVRVHSDPLYQYKASLPKDAQPESASEQLREAADMATLGRPPVDVQAAVTVLGRLPARTGTQPVADLTGAWLSKVDLAMARTLTGARLDGADLSEANLGHADLTGASLSDADLTGASLGLADLTGAYLNDANLTNASLIGAKLPEATFIGANLTGADLFEADLTGADLNGANLSEANLYGANLTEADLGEADLSGARHITQKQVDAARGDEKTKLPAGLDRPELWGG